MGAGEEGCKEEQSIQRRRKKREDRTPEDQNENLRWEKRGQGLVTTEGGENERQGR